MENSFNIVIMRENEFILKDGMDKKLILEHLKKYSIVEKIPLTSEGLMEKIVTVTKMNPDTMGDTTLCYEDCDYV